MDLTLSVKCLSKSLLQSIAKPRVNKSFRICKIICPMSSAVGGWFFICLQVLCHRRFAFGGGGRRGNTNSFFVFFYSCFSRFFFAFFLCVYMRVFSRRVISRDHVVSPPPPGADSPATEGWGVDRTLFWGRRRTAVGTPLPATAPS